MKIVTAYNPNHKDKWAAFFEDRRNDLVAFGATEAEAVQNLMRMHQRVNQ